MPDLDPAAVEAAARAMCDKAGFGPHYGGEHRAMAEAAITAYLDRSGLAEARASLEREKVNRDRDGQTFADETDRLRAERDEAVGARENANALSIRLEGERDRAVARAEAAEASLAAATEALEDLLEGAQDMRAYVPDYFAKKWHHDEALDRAREALSRLAHSSEEER